MLSTKSHSVIAADENSVDSAEIPQHPEQQAGKEYREDTVSTAQKTLAAGVLATEKILQMAGWLQEMKSRLNRKEFSAFVKGLLQWVGEEARKYLEIARAFEGFDLSRLVNLEPFTILKLRAKRYAPVIAKLREQPDITSKVVQDLIRELLLGQSRKKRDSKISGWKQCRSGGGRYYNLILHDEKTGLSIEQQAEEEGILPQRVIAEAIALRSQLKSSQMQLNEYLAAQLEELSLLVEHARALDRENRKLTQELHKRDLRIAELEAKLAERASTSESEANGVKEPGIEDEVEIASRELNEYLENQAACIAAVTECEFQTVATAGLKLEQESEYLEPAITDNLDQDSAVIVDIAALVEPPTSLSSILPNPANPHKRSNRKLQPVEILTKAGEWVGGYFVHSCIAIANLLGQERRFTLYDTDERMYTFLGQIRPPRSMAGC